jgi:hypothetical protein
MAQRGMGRDAVGGASGRGGAVMAVCAPRVRPLNLVVITLDTFRADRLGAYGSARRPSRPRSMRWLATASCSRRRYRGAA